MRMLSEGSIAIPTMDSTSTNNKPRGKKRARTSGTACVWPSGVQERYGISAVTRWRWGKTQRLPARDVFIGGVPVGWRPATLDAAERGPSV
jgi:hypothetical protein